MNLLVETLEEIMKSGHSVSDIEFICCGNSIMTDWVTYQHAANFNYDSGFGFEEVNPELSIVFKDKTWLCRREYDGSEWFEYMETPKVGNLLDLNVKHVRSLLDRRD